MIVALASIISLVIGILIGLLTMGLAIESNVEKYIIGLSSPLIISFSIGIAGFLSYKTLLENRTQAQKNRTIEIINSLGEIVDDIRIIDVNLHNWYQMEKGNNNGQNFHEMIDSMPNELRLKYNKFALTCDQIALGALDGTYHESLVMQLAIGTFWNHWLSLRLYISYIRSGNNFTAKCFCTGLENYLKTKGGLSLPKYQVPAYINNKFKNI